MKANYITQRNDSTKDRPDHWVLFQDCKNCSLPFIQSLLTTIKSERGGEYRIVNRDTKQIIPHI
jgi:hypothetical protein